MPKLRESLPNYLFILPQFVLFLLFLAWPVARGIQISLNDWKIMAVTQRFIGIQNYMEIWRDPKWWNALGNSIEFTVLVMSINTVLALLVAVLLKDRFRGRNFLRAVLYLPSVLSVTVVGVIAFRVWDVDRGLLSYFWVGLLQQAPIRWWTPGTQLMVLVLTTVWWTFGFPMLIFLAGLHAIPNTVYEAAEIDGADRWQTFWKVTLPLLGPSLLFVLSTQFMTHMQMFGQAYQLGGNNESAQTVYVYMFNNSWRYFRFGYAAAMGVAVTVLIMAVTRLLFTLLGRRVEY